MFFRASVSFVFVVLAADVLVPDVVDDVAAEALPTLKSIFVTLAADLFRSESVEPSSALKVLEVVA